MRMIQSFIRFLLFFRSVLRIASYHISVVFLVTVFVQNQYKLYEIGTSSIPGLFFAANWSILLEKSFEVRR